MEWYNAKQAEEYTDSFLKKEIEKETKHVDLSWVINALIVLEISYFILFACFSSVLVRTWLFAINLFLIGAGRFALTFSSEYSLRDIPLWIITIIIVGFSSLFLTLFTPFSSLVAFIQLLYFIPLRNLKKYN